MIQLSAPRTVQKAHLFSRKMISLEVLFATPLGCKLFLGEIGKQLGEKLITD